MLLATSGPVYPSPPCLILITMPLGCIWVWNWTGNWVSASGLLHLLFLLPGRLVPQMLPSFESLSCHLVVNSRQRLPWPSYLNCHHLSLSNLLPCFVFHHSACHYRSFMFIYCRLPPVQNLSTMRIRFCLFHSLLCSQCWELWLAHGRYSI